MEAVESVRKQTYPNWEIVLVDDCSTDNSKELYEDLEKDGRISIFYNDSNMGCGFTKRKCAELANGQLAGFLDSDDVLLERAIELMVEYHTKFPTCSLVDSKLWKYVNNIIIKENTSYNKDNDLITSKIWMISPFASFKLNNYRETIGINPNLSLAVDTDMYLLLEEVGEIGHIDQVLYLYRHDNDNSICQGTDGRKAFYFRSIAVMNAIKRRWESKISLYENDKPGYFDTYRYWLNLHSSYVGIAKSINFIIIYFKIMTNKYQALKHIAKLFVSQLKKI